jgi:hypothetical protein
VGLSSSSQVPPSVASEVCLVVSESDMCSFKDVQSVLPPIAPSSRRPSRKRPGPGLLAGSTLHGVGEGWHNRANLPSPPRLSQSSVSVTTRPRCREARALHTPTPSRGRRRVSAPLRRATARRGKGEEEFDGGLVVDTIALCHSKPEPGTLRPVRAQSAGTLLPSSSPILGRPAERHVVDRTPDIVTATGASKRGKRGSFRGSLLRIPQPRAWPHLSREEVGKKAAVAAEETLTVGSVGILHRSAVQSRFSMRTASPELGGWPGSP